MKAYPIWHNVVACNYKASKSWGSIGTSEETILVGSSIKNSYELAKIVTTRRFSNHDKYGAVCTFKFSVDGVVLTEMIFKDNGGRAGELLKTSKEVGDIM